MTIDMLGWVARPLVAGSRFAGEWTLGWAEVDQEGSALVYRFHCSRKKKPALEILVRHRDDARSCYARTVKFNIAYRAPAGTSLDPEFGRLVDCFVELVGKNESEDTSPPEGTAGGAGLAHRKMLYLVPGHLGVSQDLSRRAILILESVPSIFVEKGKAPETIALLENFGIRAGDKKILELSGDAAQDQAAMEQFRRMARGGQSVCLFGAGEGIPAFCDPGKEMISEAVRLGMPIRSVAGASSLAVALMRIDHPIEEFVFLGHFQTEDDARRVVERLLSGLDLPVILFTLGKHCRTLLPKVLRESACQRVWVMAELTSDSEKVFELDLSGECRVSRDMLEDEARTILVIQPGSPARQPELTRRPRSRRATRSPSAAARRKARRPRRT
jgi:16S rRNA C1402 (ribose-2'-O) methylase RsmI